VCVCVCVCVCARARARVHVRARACARTPACVHAYVRRVTLPKLIQRLFNTWKLKLKMPINVFP